MLKPTKWDNSWTYKQKKFKKILLSNTTNIPKKRAQDNKSLCTSYLVSVVIPIWPMLFIYILPFPSLPLNYFKANLGHHIILSENTRSSKCDSLAHAVFSAWNACPFLLNMADASHLSDETFSERPSLTSLSK